MWLLSLKAGCAMGWKRKGKEASTEYFTRIASLAQISESKTEETSDACIFWRQKCIHSFSFLSRSYIRVFQLEIIDSRITFEFTKLYNIQKFAYMRAFHMEPYAVSHTPPRSLPVTRPLAKL